MKCSHCGGVKFDEDPARGDLICAECGVVESENAVTSAVEFVENTGGTCTAIGRFVSDESQMPGFRESRYVTEQRARKRIDTICGQLRLGSDVAGSAFRYYQSALFRGFTRGRSALQLAAACIYVAARQLRVNLMLLDLSDAVAINVYSVGRTYIDLKRRLNLSLPEIDPCLFVERFASQLDFEEKTAAVATTAMRLLQRMKKDWISTGRRPSGLAAASLLVAARIHEFNRTEEDVAKVARISHLTARKRLIEFSKTPSSALSIDAFFTVDYDEEQDPPAFEQPAQKRRINLDDLDMVQVSAEIKELGRRIDNELDELARKRKLGVAIKDPDLAKSKGLKHLFAPDKANADADANDDDEAVTSAKKSRSSRQVLRDVLDGVVDPDILDSCVEDLELITAHSGNRLCELMQATQQARDARDAALEAAAGGTGVVVDGGNDTTASEDTKHFADTPSPSKPMICPTDESLKLPHFLSPIKPAPPTSSVNNGSDDQKDVKVSYAIDLTDIDEEELDREYFLNPQEVMVKATLWISENASFLEEQRRKRAEKQRLKEELAKQPRRPRRVARKIYQRQRRMPWHAPDKRDPAGAFSDDDEATQLKPLSKKINYAALETIVGEGARSEKSTPVPEAEGHASTVDQSRDPPRAPSTERANRLLETTIQDSSVPSNLFPTSKSSPALLQQAPQEEEDTEFEVEEDEPEDNEDDEEEVDWQEGEDLW